MLKSSDPDLLEAARPGWRASSTGSPDRYSRHRGQHAAGDLSRRPEPRPAGGRADHRGPAARDRRRRLGEDARAHLSRRAPPRRLRREAERDPRDHLHEQGGGGDEGARRADARPDRAGDLDHDVPLRVRPHAAQRGRAARLPLELHDLRPGRPGAPRQGVPRGARARPEAVRAARHPLADLEREEPADRPGRVRLARRELLRPDGRGRLQRSTSAVSSPRTPSTSTTC